MQIYIAMPNGKTILIDVQLDKTTVYDVKKKLMEKQGIQLEDQILLFNGTILKNDKTLKSYGIDKESNLQSETAESLAKNFKDQIEFQKEEIYNLQAKYSDEQQLREQLTTQLTALQVQNDEITQKKNSLEAELSLQKNLLEQNNKKIQQAQDLQMSQIRLQQQQGKQDELKKLELENATMKGQLHQWEMERQRLEAQIDYLKQEKDQLKNQFSDFQKLKEDLMEAKYEIRTYKREIDQLNNRGNQTQDEASNQLNQQREQIRQYESQLEDLKKTNQLLELDRVKLEYQTQNQETLTKKIHDLESQSLIYEKRIIEQKTQINSLQDQVNELQNKNQDEMRSSVRKSDYATVEKISGYETRISKLQAESKSLEIAFDDSQQQLSETKKKLFEVQKKITEYEQSIDNLKYMVKDKDTKLKDKDIKIKMLEEEIKDQKTDMQEYKKGYDQLKKVACQADPKVVKEIDSEALKVDEKLKAREEQRQKEQKQQELQKKRENEEKQQKLKEEEKFYQELMQQGKDQRLKTAQFLKKQMMETHGKLEVCFLIDVTGSMDPYKESAMKCIRESMKNIKLKTNRDALWATVAYQDFGELKQLGGLYRQLNFTQKPQELEDFLANIPCTGGGDAAEDIRGGINQMIKNLSWTKTFKIAVLICDSPNHGKKYNNGVSDRYPNEDLQDAIELLIENNILFVAILFNKVTLVMFEEIKKIYQAHDREELLLFANLENTDQGRIWQELVDLVSQASQRATQTNNKGTKSKNAQANKRSQAGAMEALCKTIKDPFQFDRLPGISCVQTKFGVIRVEIKQDSFESNIENLKRIDIARDYSVFQEGQWQCNRTEKFFAQGQMKQVFLMKRESTSNELYVIKMPLGDKQYTSQEAAILECRSHLISKCLMKKFIRELQEARDKLDKTIKIPEVQYSDFLILKDLSVGNSYWIAERYFTGEFVKYNNNFGFISDENLDINHLAQAYTYYTYFISNFNYMVSDVQGVGNYFTDPALNTKEGNFDETDMGIDGQSMFMVTYEGKRHIGKKYLDLLGINL